MGFDAQAVTDWCSRFGLLGILPQCANSNYATGPLGTPSAPPIWRKIHRVEPDQLIPVVTHSRIPHGMAVVDGTVQICAGCPGFIPVPS